MFKEINVLLDNVKYIDILLQRLDGFPDQRFVEKWFKFGLEIKIYFL